MAPTILTTNSSHSEGLGVELQHVFFGGHNSTSNNEILAFKLLKKKKNRSRMSVHAILLHVHGTPAIHYVTIF